MLKRPFARLKYAAGNIARLASRPWCQRSIPPGTATTIFGCSFGNDGWHHICRTLAEIDAAPSIRPEETTLWRFLDRFRPTSISSLAGVVDEEPLPLFVYPWGTFNSGDERTDKDPWSSRFCGPSTDAFMVEELARTMRLYAQMKQSGYQPMQFPHSYIGGTWLVAADGRRRFVVMQGNHRMAVLAHLDVRQVDVRTIPQCLAAVRETDIDRWPLVRAGRCSVRHARRVFNLFFEQDGRHVLAVIG